MITTLTKALSQAIETVLATKRAGRKRTAISKAVQYALQAQDTKRGNTGGRGGCGHSRANTVNSFGFM